MGAGNPTISGETETQVPAACQPHNDLTWKDVMYILGQMLTPDSKARVLGKVAAYGDEWLGTESVGKREDEITGLPTGSQGSQLQNQTGTITLLKEDGIRVILSDVFLKDSDRRVLSP